ncbi:MAG: alpha/beta hydrolase, partial [Acidimicrobiia bacterium]|nr:alpha/beta hydrolase [Acidimicrobiia bacterium]
MDVPAFESMDPTGAREHFGSLPRPPTVDCRDVRDIDAGGIDARLYRPVDGTTGLLVWFHGGGWVIGDIDSTEDVCRSLANRSGHCVLSIEYRLAPEHPFPAPLMDCLEATRWAHDHAGELDIDPARMAVGGDSAGGNLAAVVANIAPVPLVHQLLVYPVTDSRMGSDSYTDNAEGYFLTAAAMRWFTGHYLSGTQGSIDDPRVSPLLTSAETLRQCPPATVLTAGFDPLRDEGTAYATRLADEGVPVGHVQFADQMHGFFTQIALIADARSANALAAQALSEAFAPAGS